MRRSSDWIRTASQGEIPLPVEADLTEPSVARVYDFLLGGKDNFAIDRAAAQALLDVVPELPLIAQDNRDFLRRAVRYLVAEAGIRQIVDIGSGLPTVKNIHEIAQEADPGARVVYVDNDPIVLTHARVRLADNENTTIICADVKCPAALFEDPGLRAHIDLTEPFAVLVSGVLQHLSEAAAPARVAAEIRDRLTPGSYLLMTGFADDGGRRARDLEYAFVHGGLGTGWLRTVDEQLGYFDGLEFVEPGFVEIGDWRPDVRMPRDNTASSLYVGGVAHRR